MPADTVAGSTKTCIKLPPPTPFGRVRNMANRHHFFCCRRHSTEMYVCRAPLLPSFTFKILALPFFYHSFFPGGGRGGGGISGQNSRGVSNDFSHRYSSNRRLWEFFNCTCSSVAFRGTNYICLPTKNKHIFFVNCFFIIFILSEFFLFCKMIDHRLSTMYFILYRVILSFCIRIHSEQID
jgi:hypothetical protein